MFGIPTIAKAHPTTSARGNSSNNNSSTAINNNNKSAFAHVKDSSPARQLPPTNHTRTNLSHFYDDDDDQTNNNTNNSNTHSSKNTNEYGTVVVVTGRRRAPADNPSCPQNQKKSGVHSAPWAESAPGAPVTSTTQEMYQSAEDRDRNFRKHLRKQFREYHLEHLIPTTLTCKEEELADIIIRACDSCIELGITDIEGIIIAKHQYNQTREYKHGNKRS